MGLTHVNPIPNDKVERYWPNANYGNARTLKLFSGYPLDKPIHAVIPHGVFYEDDHVFPGEAQAPGCSAVLNWPAHRDTVWSQYKEVVPCAAPYVYALRTYPHTRERRGTLVMPQHSTNLYDMDYDWGAFADLCRDLPRPVTVALYWNDVDRGAADYFPFKTVCFGHVNQQAFLERQVLAMTGARHVVSNEIGSYTYYSVLSGCSFSLLHEPPMMRINNPEFKSVFRDWDDKHPEEQRRMTQMTELFKEWRDEPNEAQIEAAMYYLRVDAMKDAEGLRSDLEYCEALHKERQAARLCAVH